MRGVQPSYKITEVITGLSVPSTYLFHQGFIMNTANSPIMYNIYQAMVFPLSHVKLEISFSSLSSVRGHKLSVLGKL